MTFILPPPMWVAGELLKVDLASFLRSATDTTLDRKTLVKVTLGQAAARTLARLAGHFRRRHPELAGYLDIIRGRRAEELAAQGRLEDFEIEDSISTWRAGVEGAAMAASEAGEPFLLTIMWERLLSLEDASMRAEVLFRKAEFLDAGWIDHEEQARVAVERCHHAVGAERIVQIMLFHDLVEIGGHLIHPGDDLEKESGNDC